MLTFIEAFKSLKTNNKYGRKSPHKAVLLLTLIDMYEREKITSNEIYYNQELKDEFNKTWVKLLPHETLFSPELFFPFWFMKAEPFWDVITFDGKEDVVMLMNDKKVKPSESKIIDCVKYAELDSELYFLLTMSYGRKELKQALLETYFDFTDEEILSFVNTPIINDRGTFEIKPDSPNNGQQNGMLSESDTVLTGYKALSLETQICLNLTFYRFLEENKYQRDEFVEFVPDILSLYDRVILHPLSSNDGSIPFRNMYVDFLKDLRLELMGVNDAIDFVDSIKTAIDIIENEVVDKLSDTESVNLPDGIVVDNHEETEEHIETYTSFPTIKPSNEDRRGKRWEEEEEVNLIFLFKQGHPFEEIALAIGRSEVSIKSRLAGLGLIEYDYEKEKKGEIITDNQVDVNVDDNSELTGEDFYIQNTSARCFICDRTNTQIYSSSGKLKMFDGIPYRIAFTYSHISINILMRHLNGTFSTGERIIYAKSKTPLYKSLTEYGFLDDIKEIKKGAGEYVIKVCDQWYNSDGELNSYMHRHDKPASKEVVNDELPEYIQQPKEPEYEPKGKLRVLKDVTESSFDFLWVMAIVDLEMRTNRRTHLTLDELACMMIANAWELMAKDEEIRKKEVEIRECIEFLIEESKEYMETTLSWNSTKGDVYQAIKDYPMADVFEDTVEKLVESAPYNILRLWYYVEDETEIEMLSKNYSKPALYAFHNRKIDPFIEVNKNWQNNLYYDGDKLIAYFTREYIEFMKEV